MAGPPPELRFEPLWLSDEINSTGLLIMVEASLANTAFYQGLLSQDSVLHHLTWHAQLRIWS